jgi:hypothetical protein
MRVVAPQGGARDAPDRYLLTSQTCFFTLTLPRYSSKEVLRRRLLASIGCVEMDADFLMRSAADWDAAV